MVLAALYNWVYDKLQRLNSEYATLIRKVQKLGISSSEADRTKASALGDAANSRLEIFAAANKYISQRRRGEGLERDGVVGLYNLGFQAIQATKTNKVPAEVRAIFTAIGKRADASGPDGLRTVAYDSESLGNRVRYGDFLAGRGNVKDVVGNLLTVSCNISRHYVDENGLGRAEAIEQTTFFNLESMRRLGVRHVIRCYIDSIKDFPSEEEAEAAAEAELRADAKDGDEEDDGIADEEDSDDLCGNHIPRGGAPLNLCDVYTGEEEEDGDFVFEDDESEESSEEEEEEEQDPVGLLGSAPAASNFGKYKQEQERFAMYLLAKVLRAYGVLDISKNKWKCKKFTYEDLDAAVKELHRRITLPDEADGKLKNCVWGGPEELETFLRNGCRGGAVPIWQFSNTNRSGVEKSKRGMELWTTCSDFVSLVLALAMTEDDGKVSKQAHKTAKTKLLEIMPAKKVCNLRALVSEAFPNWNKKLDPTVIQDKLKRKDKFRAGTPGFGAESMIKSALAAHRCVKAVSMTNRGLMDDAEGAPALLKVANIDPFAHMDDEGFKERYTKDVDGLAQLRFDDLVKGFHVCIVDVAAMIDIITIAISAVVLKAMAPRATA